MAFREIDNLPLLNLAASSGLPIIISTGMADEEEISAAIETGLSAGLLPDQTISFTALLSIQQKM